MLVIVQRHFSRSHRGHYVDSKETWRGGEESLSCSWRLALITAIVGYCFWVEGRKNMMDERCFTIYRYHDLLLRYSALPLPFCLTRTGKGGGPCKLHGAHLPCHRNNREEVVEQITRIRESSDNISCVKLGRKSEHEVQPVRCTHRSPFEFH